MDFHVFPGGEVAVEAGILKDDAETLARFVLVGLRVEPVEFDGAAGGLEQRGEHLDGGGLPCAVGPEEGEDLAFVDFEGDVVDGGEGAEGFDEVADTNHGGRSRVSILNRLVKFVNSQDWTWGVRKSRTCCAKNRLNVSSGSRV